MKIFLLGATGFVGGHLVPALHERGDELIVLTRDTDKAEQRLGTAITLVAGDPAQPGDWMKRIDGCDAVINLAGENIFARRWNDLFKIELRNSRVVTTLNVVEAIARSQQKPPVLVNTSAIGYYGNHADAETQEDGAGADDFMAHLCADWEQAAHSAEEHGTRVAIVRTGVVLGPDGGALEQMITPFKLGVGGPVAGGRQWMSWVHVDDLVGIYQLALDNADAKGPINGTAPEPVTNKEFSKTLAATLHRPCLFPLPGFMLRLMLGEVAQVVTGSQRVIPAKAKELGYKFKYPTCEQALRALFPG